MHVDCSGDAAVLKTAAEELFHTLARLLAVVHAEGLLADEIADCAVLVLVQQVDKSSRLGCLSLPTRCRLCCELYRR